MEAAAPPQPTPRKKEERKSSTHNNPETQEIPRKRISVRWSSTHHRQCMKAKPDFRISGFPRVNSYWKLLNRSLWGFVVEVVSPRNFACTKRWAPTPKRLEKSRTDKAQVKSLRFVKCIAFIAAREFEMSRIAPFFFSLRPVPARRSAKCTAEQTVDKLRLLACDSWLGADSQPIRAVKINSLCTVHRTSPDITGLQPSALRDVEWRVENLWRDFHLSLSTRAFQWPISSEPLTKMQMFHLQPLWFDLFPWQNAPACCSLKRCKRCKDTFRLPIISPFAEW